MMKHVNLLVWLTQLGISVAAPLGGFIWLAVWLQQRFQWGSWVVIVGVILGLLCAIEGFFTAMKAMRRMAKEKEEQLPIAFNDHD